MRIPVALLALILLALPPAIASAQAGGAPARASVQIPQTDAKVVMLELRLRVARTVESGHPGAVVRLRGAEGSAVEVGRLSFMPAAFGAEQRFQFDIAGAVRSLGLAGRRADVEVEATDRAGGSAPPSVAIAGARVVTR